VGNDLGVRAVLTGRILHKGDDLIVSAELTDVRDNKQLWGDRYQRRISDLLEVQKEIARAISENLRPTLSGANRNKLSKQSTNNPEAYQLYRKGHYTEREFKRGLELNPNYELNYELYSYSLCGVGEPDEVSAIARYAGLRPAATGTLDG
jgi:Predicted integral membrane protein